MALEKIRLTVRPVTLRVAGDGPDSEARRKGFLVSFQGPRGFFEKFCVSRGDVMNFFEAMAECSAVFVNVEVKIPEISDSEWREATTEYSVADEPSTGDDDIPF